MPVQFLGLTWSRCATGLPRGKMVNLTGTGQDGFRGILNVPVDLGIVPGSVPVVWKRPCGDGTFKGKVVILTGVDRNGLGAVQNDVGARKHLPEVSLKVDRFDTQSRCGSWGVWVPRGKMVILTRVDRNGTGSA